MWVLVTFMLMTSGTIGLGLHREHAYQTWADCEAFHDLVKQYEKENPHLITPLPPGMQQEVRRCVYVVIMPSKE